MDDFLAQVAAMKSSLQQQSNTPQLVEIDNDTVTIMGETAPSGSSEPSGTEALQSIVDQCGDLFPLIIEILQSSSSNEELQITLADLLGYDKLELLISLIRARTDLVAFDLQRQRQATVDKNRRSNAERSANLKMAKDAEQYPHVYTNSVDGQGGGNMLSAFGTKYHLPEGTTRMQESYYEEVIIPYPKVATRGRAAAAMQVPLIQISDLDTICKGTFSKYQTLNRMQTLVYPIAYETIENMLVCAPTGAGKTDVALLTMLNTIRHHMNTETQEIQYEEFKIIYIAPLKALAAEIVEKMGSRLGWLGIKVRELTGDMQLTRQEIDETQVIVTTPEKWDVVTRKSQANEDLITKVKLLIIDEVHLLHEERGAVIESLVARTLRQVERTQSLIRIVGLSATLPNYLDVAEFLKVNPKMGLFFFDGTFRPCPLKQEFVAVRGKAGSKQSADNIDNICFEKLLDSLREGHQVMVFVHSRKDTVRTARTFIAMAQKNDKYRGLFDCTDSSAYESASREMSKFKNRDMKDLFMAGFGVHHAGLTRSERNMSEKLFGQRSIKVLCSTATLAWGVNLPAAVVIIKGTQLYDSQRGGYVDLGISDVIQIFGRAGRPQFEKFGTGILITSLDKLGHYLGLITQQHPIESRLLPKLADNLNAEISLGTVTTVDEGVQWLGYTYLFVRMRKNPLIYGMTWRDIEDDPRLGAKRRSLIVSNANRLHDLQMIIHDTNTDTFVAKDTGRIASDFYLQNHTVEVFNQLMKIEATEADIIAMISMSGEFDSIKPRNEETVELRKLLDNDDVQMQVAGVKSDGTVDSPEAKVNILLQSYISQANITDSALNSDSLYVAQNASRICRSVFLLAVNRRWAVVARLVLILCQSIDRRMWWFDEHPLGQFSEINGQVLQNLNSKMTPITEMKDMSAGELGDLVHNSRMGATVAKCVDRFPLLDIDKVVVQPITSRVLRVHLNLVRDFKWDAKYHGSGNSGHMFWVWVEDTDSGEMLHVEKVLVSRGKESAALDFTIPLPEKRAAEPDPDGEEVPDRPKQLLVRTLSDWWIGAEASHVVSFEHLITPDTETVTTKLLRLRPLPKSALDNPVLDQLYKFDYFNPMQTMVFHTLYHSQTSVLLGSPTGSGKTVACELAIWAAFRDFPGCKVVYVAPMKALVRERVDDWKTRFAGVVNVVELTGDTNPDASEIRAANIIITTPEKFDGLSRNWQTRKFVQEVKLVVMDEVHLLASDRGAILEMIVSRMRISMKSCPRLLGMSTAVANATDLASWLGVEDNRGLFNFPPSVRPVPLQMYIDGFPDKPFGPLMSSMHKPAFLAIKRHSLGKPCLVFVPSRRQTRLTAQEFINLCAGEEDPRKFVRMDEFELEQVLSRVHDETLRSALQFGIGVHHAGLVDSDRRIAHELFASNKIQILIATSTLAWGVNLPAYLVIVKGTMFYDQKREGYKNMDLTDVLQMMGRAGRPGFDNSGVACVLTKDSTKGYYKYFLNSGFPVESSLHLFFPDHLGAEISNNAIKSKQQAMEFITSTFLFRRVHKNPSFYQIFGEDSENEEQVDIQTAVNKWFVKLVDDTLEQLSLSGCVVTLAYDQIEPTKFLRITSFYYLSHKTMRFFLEHLPRWNSASFETLEAPLRLLSLATEYDELAIRHNEDVHNEEFSNMKGIKYHGNTLGPRMVDPHVKAFLLVQSHMSKMGVNDLPLPDYFPDRIAVLDQSLRILQAAIDTAAELGSFLSVMNLIKLMICIKQATWEPKVEDPTNPRTSPKLDLKRVNQDVTITSKSPRIVPSRFHKPQQQSWFIIEHDVEKSAVISLKRWVPPRTLKITITHPTLVINDTKLIAYELN